MKERKFIMTGYHCKAKAVKSPALVKGKGVNTQNQKQKRNEPRTSIKR